MKPADVAIWERYIIAHPDAYGWVEYDFLVGSAPAFDTTVNAETGGSAEALYRRKIDVVAHRDDDIDIIELKPAAGPAALGQVLAYLHLYVRDERPSRAPRPVIITDMMTTDMEELARTMGVHVIIA